MIVSHRHRFIFIKTVKTAGTSIEVFLSQRCGPGDVLTPIDPPHELHQPRNCAGFYNHMQAIELRRVIAPDIWNSYYKFCVERNPWDKALSWYHHLNATRFAGELSLDACLAEHDQPLGHYYYTDHRGDGSVLVDRVVRYEHLETELAEVFTQLGIDFDGDLGVRAKGEYRRNKRHYRDELSQAQAARIATLFAKDIALHGYTF